MVPCSQSPPTRSQRTEGSTEAGSFLTVTWAMEHKDRAWQPPSYTTVWPWVCILGLSMSHDEFLHGNDSVQYLCCAGYFYACSFISSSQLPSNLSLFFIGFQVNKSPSKKWGSFSKISNHPMGSQSLKPRSFLPHPVFCDLFQQLEIFVLGAL